MKNDPRKLKLSGPVTKKDDPREGRVLSNKVATNGSYLLPPSEDGHTFCCFTKIIQKI